MFKKLLIIAAIGAGTSNAANVGWRKGNCPKAGSIKTNFTANEREEIVKFSLGSWMVIADDK